MPGPQDTLHDVVVVGARCAGSATARLLAARGYDVVLLERAELPSDTLSTHGILRGGVVQLARWGLLEQLVAGGAPPVREVVFGSEEGFLRRPVKPAAGVDHLLAPRRDRLDAVLASAAVVAGARLWTGTTVTGLVRDDGGRVVGVRTRDRVGRTAQVRARHVVGADGLRSTVAQQVGARTLRCFASDATVFYTYVTGAWPAFEFHVSEHAFAGVFPTHDAQANVWLSRPARLLDDVRRAGSRRAVAWRDELAATFPALAAAVAAGELTAPVRGCVAPPNFVKQAWGPGWALVGDAGYHRDPITGHGITDAFRDAELLAEALGAALDDPGAERESLDGYQAERDRALADTWRLTRALTRFPSPRRFVELEKELSGVLEHEAFELASRPAPAGLPAAPAA